MNPWRGLSGLPRTSWILATATLINRAGVMVRPFLVIYLTQHLGYPESAAGNLLALYGATTLVAAPLSGRLSDRFGARTVLRISLVLSGCILLCYPLARELWQLTVATVAFAFFNEMPRPALMTLVADAAPAARRKQAFVLSRVAINLGLSIGPSAGGILAEHSFLLLFLVDAACTLAAAALLCSVRLPRGHVETERQAPGSGLLRDRSLQLFFVGTVLSAIVFFQHDSSLALVMTGRLGMRNACFGFNIAVNTLLIVLLEVWINTRTQHWSHRRSLVLGTLLTALGFGGYLFATEPVAADLSLVATLLTPTWLLIAGATVVWTFGEMLAMPAMSAFVHELAPPGRRGSYMATLSLAFGLGLAAGPWLGTRLLQHGGPEWLWPAMFGVGLLSAVLYWRLPTREVPGPAA